MSTLVAEELRNDSRVAEGKRLILEALQEHSKKITGVRPACEDRKLSYNEILDAFADVRGGKLWYPYIGSGVGNGALVELADGSVKYDFIIGIGVHYFGHSHPGVVEATIDGAIGNTTMQGHLQQNSEQFELSRILTTESGMDHCFLTSSGVMANENALKVMFQKKAPACRVLAFENCFMGRTWSCSQITDKPGGRDGLPLNVQVDYVPFYDHSRPEESTAESLRVLRRHIARYPGQHAAMVFELVQGEGGIKPGTHDFFVTLMKELKEQGIAIFDDEVQTFGRTPELFAFKHFGLENYVDVVSIGKLSQVCATLYRSEFKPRPGLLSQTFTSSTTTVYAAKMMIQTLLDQGYYGKSGKISKLHDYFTSKLQEISDRHPDLIEGPYGVGAMIAFTPLGGDAKKVSRLTHALFEAGVICFTAGSSPARIRFLVPAAVVTHDDIDKVCKILEDTLIREGQVVTA